MIRKITFPPILLFTVIATLAIVVNCIALFSENAEVDSELYMLQISTSLDKDKLNSPGRISVTISVEGTQKSSYAAIYVYDPNNRLYTIKETTMDGGFAIFDIWFGWGVKKGNYTIIPAVGLSKHKVVLGAPVFIEIGGYGGV